MRPDTDRLRARQQATNDIAFRLVSSVRWRYEHVGVSCTFCHVGSDSAPLERIAFATDEKRKKRVARQMMRMVQEVNNRLDTIPVRPTAMCVL